MLERTASDPWASRPSTRGPRCTPPAAKWALLLVGGLAFRPGAAQAHGDEPHAVPSAIKVSDQGSIRLAKESQFLLGVRTEVAVMRPLVERWVVPGRVIPTPAGYARVTSPVPGRLVPVKGGGKHLGQRVEAGEILAYVDPRLSGPEAAALSADRIKAESAVREAQAAREQAERSFLRLQSLSGVVAQKEIEAAELGQKLARQVEAKAQAEAQIFRAAPGTTTLARFPVVAPIGGLLANISPAAYAQVAPEQALYEIQQPGHVWIEAKAYAADLPVAERATDAQVELPAYPGKRWRAQILGVSPQLDEKTGTLSILIDLEDPDPALRPGAYAEVGLAIEGPVPGLAVPEVAILRREGQARLLIHTGPERFELRPVVVGHRDGAYRAVISGLASGERVVIAGAQALLGR